ALSRGRACQRGRLAAGGDIEAGHVERIADKQVAPADGRVVPSFSGDGRKPDQLFVLLRRGQHDSQVPIATKDDQLSTGEQHLAVVVAPRFPPPRAGLGVDASKNVFIQSVNVSLPENRTGELVLEVLVPPYLPCREGFL